MSSDQVAETVSSLMPRAKAELAALVAFRSVADFDQFPRGESVAAAEWTAAALRAEGFEDIELLNTPDGTQSVYGYLPGPEGAKTVLLYAHYDVQPPLDEAGSASTARRWSARPRRCRRAPARW